MRRVRRFFLRLFFSPTLARSMPSAVANGVALLVLFGGVSPAAGQNNVFPNRTALLVARDAWCADPTAAAAIYGPINSWDISQVTDLSFVFCARSDEWGMSQGCRRWPLFSAASSWPTTEVASAAAALGTDHPHR